MTTPGERRTTRGHVVVLAVVALLVLVLDLATKQLALARLSEGESVPVLGDLLSLRLVFNPGAAFSIATGMTWVFTLIAAGVVVVVARVAPRLGSRTWAVALGMLLGGAVGNLVDRLARPPGFAQGHVVDFIDYAGLFVGNVADVAIVGAAVLIGWLGLRGVGVDGRRHGAVTGATDGAGAPEQGRRGEEGSDA
jgi:signal peptidase II